MAKDGKTYRFEVDGVWYNSGIKIRYDLNFDHMSKLHSIEAHVLDELILNRQVTPELPPKKKRK